MQLPLHATRQAPHGASRLVHAMSACSMKTRHAPSRHCRNARVNGHTTTAVREMSTPHPPTPSCNWCVTTTTATTAGPIIDMRYGRVDVVRGEECPKEGNLPDGNAPFGDGSQDAPSHLRNVFHRMGFSDQEIVALSGAHTIGR